MVQFSIKLQVFRKIGLLEKSRSNFRKWVCGPSPPGGIQIL